MSPWLPLAPCTPATCVPPPALHAAFWRRLIRWGAVAGLLTGGVVIALLRLDVRWTRLWTRLIHCGLGVRIHMSAPLAEALPGGVLIVANHISWLDPLVLATVRPARLLAKDEVRRYPIVGALAAAAGTLFIDRDSLLRLPGAVASVADALRSGASVIAFPEGTTWCGRSMGRFRPAVFQAALDAGVPVRPVALRYRLGDGSPATAPAYVGEDTLFASMCRVVAAEGLVAEVTVLPEIPVGRVAHRGALARLAEDEVIEALQPARHLEAA